MEKSRVLVSMPLAFLILILPLESYTYDSPALAVISDFNFGAAGDWAGGSNTLNTVSNMVNRDIELSIGLGDYAYTLGPASVNSWWDNIMTPLHGKFKGALGNHDVTDQATYSSLFGQASWYYSFDYENVHFVVIDPHQTYSAGSAQYNFVSNDLAAASNNPNIKWIIAALHEPIYTSPTTHAASNSLRNGYHPLFDQYGVDLVLESHNHNYQRTFPLKYNVANATSPLITSTESSTYTNPDGEIYALIGTAGQVQYPLNGQSPFVATQFTNAYGYLDVSIISDGSVLKGVFYANNGTILDSFTINKSDGGAPPPNSAPISNAGSDITAIEGESVTLKGSASSDPDGDIPLTFSWTQTTGPTVTLDNPSNSNPGFVAPQVTAATTLEFSLTVTDNRGLSSISPDLVSVTVMDSPQGAGYNYSPSRAFTGTSYQDFSSSSSLQVQRFTVATWFLTTQDVSSGADAFIANKGGSGSETAGKNMNYGIWLSGSENVRAGFETSTGKDYFVTSPLTYRDGLWHYAAVTYNGAKLILYIDGTQVAARSVTASSDVAGSQPFRLGANSLKPNGYFIGNVDETRIWNRALSSSEITNAYNTGAFDISDQVLYISFS